MNAKELNEKLKEINAELFAGRCEDCDDDYYFNSTPHKSTDIGPCDDCIISITMDKIEEIRKTLN